MEFKTSLRSLNNLIISFLFLFSGSFFLYQSFLESDAPSKVVWLIVSFVFFYLLLFMTFQKIILKDSTLLLIRTFGFNKKIELNNVYQIEESLGVLVHAYWSLKFFTHEEKFVELFTAPGMFTFITIDKLLETIEQTYPDIKIIKANRKGWKG